MTAFHEEHRRKLERIYTRVNEMLNDIDNVYRDVYDRAYIRADAPAEGSSDYAAAQDALDAIERALIKLDEASIVLADAL